MFFKPRYLFVIAGVILFSYSFYFFYSFLDSSLTLKDFKDLPEIKRGDLIFREGKSKDSAVIKYISNSKFSHIGVVYETEPLRIIHATTDDNLQNPNKVIISDISEFLKEAKNIAFKRINLESNQVEIFLNGLEKNLGKDFILYGLDSSELERESKPIYCTTLIETELRKIIPINIEYELVNFPFLSGYYLFPKAFYDNIGELIYESFY